MKRKILIIISFILSFVIPASVFLFALKSNEIYPFGDSTILFVDSQGQYIAFLNYFRSILRGENNIKYTFAKPLGGDMVSMFLYYLVSPFNLIYSFFSQEGLPLAIAIVTILKIGTIGITMCVYLTYTSKNNPLINTFFAISYALCSYVVVYNFNFMFLDGVICLPLVVLGIDKIFKNNNKLPYVIFLSLTILINYYIGFMVCFFSVVYFLYKLYSREYSKQEKKNLFLSFIIGSLLAGGISSFSWLSALINMSGAKASLSTASAFSMRRLWEISSFLKNFTTSSYLGMPDIINGAPLVYIGVISLVLSLTYFLNTQISNKKKISAGCFILLYIFIMLFATPNNLLHGGSAPVWFTFRYAFTFNFFLIYLGHKSFENLDGLKLHHFVVPFAFLSLVAVILKLHGVETRIYFDILISLIAFLIVFAIKCAKKEWLTTLLTFLLLSINLINLNANTKHVINTNKVAADNGSTSYLSYEKYKSEINEIGSIIQYTKDYDTSEEFYRMEKTFYSQATYNMANNDSFMFDYNGLTHYSSCDKLTTRTYLANYMGFHKNNSWAGYGLGSTLTANSLLGVKYILDRDFEYNSVLIPNRHFGARNYLTHIKSFDSHYGDQIHLFKNDLSLPLVYLSNYKDGGDTSITNAFAYQNNMLKNLTNKDFGDVFKVLPHTESYQNLTQIDDTHFKLTTSTSAGYINYRVTLDSSVKHFPMYYYITPGFYQHMSLSDTRNLYYFNSYNYAINPIEHNSSQTNKTYTLKLNDNLAWDSVAINPYFYYEDIDVLRQYINVLKANESVIKEVSSSFLRGTLTYSEDTDTIMTSIPFEKKWKVKINNKTVPTTVRQNLFLAVNLKNMGFNDGDILNIELQYVTTEFTYAFILLLTSCAYLVLVDYSYGKKLIKFIKKDA